ncbi:hypothetical protein [Chlamydia vaughanii]|uniref:hypothetical protein n=1 Tax=Chlamydia vaughanii TaxID=3112552 RepID=UPI0032B122A8
MPKVFNVEDTFLFEEDTHEEDAYRPQTSIFCMVRTSKCEVLIGARKLRGDINAW